MPLPIVQGSRINEKGDTHTIAVYPVNTYFKQGKMRAIAGTRLFANCDGIDRNGFFINNENLKGHFRVIHNQFVEVGAPGDVHLIDRDFIVPGNDRVKYVASISNLVFVADKRLFLYNREDGIREVTHFKVFDNDSGEWVNGNLIGDVIDVIWIKQQLIILSQTKPVTGTGLIKMWQGETQNDEIFNEIRNEIDDTDPDHSVALEAETDFFILFNKSTITFYFNQTNDTDAFTYLPAQSKQIRGGLVGRDAKAKISNTWAIISVNADNQEPNIFLIGSTLIPLAPIEIQNILKNYAESELQNAVLESFQQDGIEFLICHLKKHTFIYNSTDKLWSILQSRSDKYDPIPFRGHNIVRDQRTNLFIVGDKYRPRLGILDQNVGYEYDDAIYQILFTEYQLINGAIRHLLLSGNLGDWPTDQSPLLKIQCSESGITFGKDLAVRLPAGRNYISKVSLRNIGFIKGKAMFRISMNSRYKMELDAVLYINEEADEQVNTL